MPVDTDLTTRSAGPSTPAKPPRFAARWVRGSPEVPDWPRRLSWLFWVQIVWFVSTQPAHAGLQSGWDRFVTGALVLGELVSIPLGIRLCAKIGRRWALNAGELFVRLVPPASIGAMVIAAGLYYLVDYRLSEWLRHSGSLRALSSESLRYWFVFDRFTQLAFLTLAASYFALRLGIVGLGAWIATSEEVPCHEPATTASRHVGLWLLAAVALVLPSYLPGFEDPRDSVGLPLFFAVLLLLEGLASRAVFTGKTPENLGGGAFEKYLRTWVLTSITVYAATLLAGLAGGAAGWESSWRIAPALLSRAVVRNFSLDPGTLANVVAFWLLRVALCRHLLTRSTEMNALKR